MADMVTIKTAHLLRRGKTGRFPKGSTVTVTRAEYEQNPGMGELVSGEEAPEMKTSARVVDLPVEDFDAGNGPMVERLVASPSPATAEVAPEPATAKKPRGRRPKARG